MALVIIVALALIVTAYIVGEKNGDATGYERGTFDGRQKARNEAALATSEAARRQRETAERARQVAPAPKVIDDMPAVPEVIAAKPVVPIAAARHSGKHKSRHR